MEFESAIKILKKRIFFQKYGFIRKIELFHLRMKHNIIQMIATAGLTVPHSFNPIFQYIFDRLGFNPMNGNFDFVFQGLNRLWMVSVTLRGGQLTSEFRLVIRFSKTMRKRSIVTSVVWQMARPVETKYRPWLVAHFRRKMAQ